MPPTLTQSNAMRYQNPIPKPELPADVRRELRFALLQTVSALECRPCPRDLWDDLGRRDADDRNLWLDRLPTVLRHALEAGRQEGVGSQAATLHRIDVFFDKLRALTVAGYEVSPASDLDGALIELTRETGDVATAAARALSDPSDGNLEALRFEIMEVEQHDATVLDLTSRRVAAGHHHRGSAALALR